MAILIHKVEKKELPNGKKIFSFEMTPEKSYAGKKKQVTYKIDSIDLFQSGEILIADRDKKIQRDLENYLNFLDYPRVQTIDTAIDLFSYIRRNKFMRKSSVFCFCDYQILKLPDWIFLQDKFKKNKVNFTIVALVPESSQFQLSNIYNTHIAETLEKPIHISHLRKILFRYIGPPLKKIAQ